MSMKKILSLLMIALTVSLAVSASPALTLCEGDIDGLMLYASDGTALDPLSDVGESGMVIKTGDAAASFTSDYGDIHMEDNSLLAVTGFDISAPSLYLVYGGMDIVMKSDLQMTVFTPASSTIIPGEGEFVFISTDDAELFMNLSGKTVTAYDGIRGINETVEPLEKLDYLAWPRHIEEVTAEEYSAVSVTGALKTEESEPAIPSSPSFEETSLELPEPEAAVINVERPEAAVPSSPSLSGPELTVEVEPVIIEIEKSGVPSAPVIGEPVIVTITEEKPAEETSAPETAAEEPAVQAVPEAETPAAEVLETAPGAEEPETAAEETAEPEVPAAAALTPEALPEKSDADGFDIRLGARAYGDQSGTAVMRAALQPSYRSGSFTLTLNIDPFAIYEGIGSESISEWIGFGTDFIDEISYYGDSAVLAMDRTSFLEEDGAGLFTGLDHAYDGAYSALSLNHEFDSEFYSHRLWFDDLSFRRIPGEGNGGVELTVKGGSAYPLSITAGAAGTVRPDMISDFELYPEAALYIPFVWNGAEAGLKLAGATMFNDSFAVNPFTENGYLVSASIPVSFGGFSAELGAAWSEGLMHYGMIGNTAYSPVPGSNVTFLASAEYGNKYFGIRVKGWTDLNLDTMTLGEENSYAEASAYASIYGFRLFGGFRTQFDEPVSDAAEYYAGIGTVLGPLDSNIMMSYSADNGFALTLASSVSMFGKESSKAEMREEAAPFSAVLETGFEYDADVSMPLFTVIPIISVGSGDLALALRAPVRMTYSSGEFLLKGFNGYDEWDFGSSETSDSMKIYRAVTDSFALIESISLGNEDESLAYLSADRGYRKNGTLFTEFGTDEALAVRAGFNFPNLALSVYADNAEAPHIVEGGLTFYPASYSGPSFSIKVPGEILMQSTFKDYAMLFYPELRLSVPFADRSYELSIYAIGEISTVYQHGDMASSGIIYDFSSGAMYDYMAGAQFRMDLGTVALSVEGGIRNGRLTPDMFTALSAERHDTAGNLSDIAAERGSSAMQYYAKAALSLDFGFFDLTASYSASDLLGYAAEPGDYISLAIGGNVSDSVRLYASFAKDDFTSSLRSRTSFMDYITTDALFSLGADFSFGRAGFTAELGSGFRSSIEDYINVPASPEQADVRLTVKARLAF